MAKDTKNINIEISIPCWKKLKIMSISKDMTLQDVVIEVLEKSVSSKKFNNSEEES